MPRADPTTRRPSSRPTSGSSGCFDCSGAFAIATALARTPKSKRADTPTCSLRARRARRIRSGRHHNRRHGIGRVEPHAKIRPEDRRANVVVAVQVLNDRQCPLLPTPQSDLLLPRNVRHRILQPLAIRAVEYKRHDEMSRSSILRRERLSPRGYLRWNNFFLVLKCRIEVVKKR